MLRGMIEPPRHKIVVYWLVREARCRLLEWSFCQASLHENAKIVKHRTLALAEEPRS